jgi:hypothetical protein
MMLKALPKIGNQYIPAILCAVSVALAILWVFATGGENPAMGIFTGITQGVIVWLAAWVSYEKGIKMLGVATENQGGGEE